MSIRNYRKYGSSPRVYKATDRDRYQQSSDWWDNILMTTRLFCSDRTRKLAGQRRTSEVQNGGSFSRCSSCPSHVADRPSACQQKSTLDFNSEAFLMSIFKCGTAAGSAMRLRS